MISRAMEKALEFPSPEAGVEIPEEGATNSWKVVLAAHAEGPFKVLTTRYDDLAVDAFPIPPYLVLQCTGNEEGLDEVQRSVGATRALLHATRASGRRTLFLDGVESVEGFISLLTTRAAHVLPPIRIQRGEARVTLLIESGTDLRALAEMFPGGKLLSKRALGDGSGMREALASPLLFPSLTAKQASALVAAYDAGYYEVPRRVTTEDVSSALGVARSTFQEHLNRAEQQIVRATLPLVRMRAATHVGGLARAQDEVLAVYSRFSRELGLYVRLEVLGERVSRVLLTHDRPERAELSHPYLTRILEHLRTGTGDLNDIPLHLEVTPFERRVLDLLRTIPPGDTVTYGELARRIGHSKAARAVGQAVARNPVPVVIPCHRVVPASGGIGQYSGGDGPATKRKLLDREGALTTGLPLRDGRRGG